MGISCGADALGRVLDTQKQNCSVKIYQLVLDAGETVPFAFKGILELYRAGYEQPSAAKYKLSADTVLVCPDKWYRLSGDVRDAAYGRNGPGSR